MQNLFAVASTKLDDLVMAIKILTATSADDAIVGHIAEVVDNATSVAPIVVVAWSAIRLVADFSVWSARARIHFAPYASKTKHTVRRFHN